MKTYHFIALVIGISSIAVHPLYANKKKHGATHTVETMEMMRERAEPVITDEGATSGERTPSLMGPLFCTTPDSFSGVSDIYQASGFQSSKLMVLVRTQFPKFAKDMMTSTGQAIRSTYDLFMNTLSKAYDLLTSRGKEPNAADLKHETQRLLLDAGFIGVDDVMAKCF